MRRLGQTSVQLWLVAALFGLSGLLLAGAAPHDEAAAAADAFQKDALTTGAWQHAAALPSNTGALTPEYLRHASRALQRTSTSATLFGKAAIVARVFTEDLSAYENLLPLGDRSRTSGPSRAPPSA